MKSILTTVHRYHLRIFGDTVSVIRLTGEIVTVQHVKGLLRFALNARTLRFAWGQFPGDGDEVIYLFDEADDNFGYAVNLNDPTCSEWGYAPPTVQVEYAI